MSQMCNECSAEISEGMKFCPKCGAKTPEKLSEESIANQAKLAPKGYLTGAEWNWITAYTQIIEAARSGKPHPNFVRGGLKDGFVKSSPYGAMVSEGARKNAEDVRKKMMAGTFDIFAGELKDNTGKVVIPKGKIFKQTDAELEGMNYLVEGVIGKV